MKEIHVKQFNKERVRYFDGEKGERSIILEDLRKIIGCGGKYLKSALGTRELSMVMLGGRSKAGWAAPRAAVSRVLKQLAGNPGRKLSVWRYAKTLKDLSAWFELEFPAPMEGLKEMPPKEESAAPRGKTVAHNPHRTKAQKRDVIVAALRDPELFKLDPAELAKMLGVGVSTVWRYRKVVAMEVARKSEVEPDPANMTGPELVEWLRNRGVVFTLNRTGHPTGSFQWTIHSFSAEEVKRLDAITVENADKIMDVLIAEAETQKPEVVEAEMVDELEDSEDVGEEIPEVVDADSMALVVVQRTNEIVAELKTEGGQVFCSSLDVARRFGKEHKNVLQSIQRYQAADYLQSFTGLNFQLSSYKDTSGKSNSMYLMTRDGMTFLVNGFNGKEADLWKICYIAAFNAMEKKLRELSAPPPLPTNPGDLLVYQAKMFLGMAETQNVHEKRLTMHDEHFMTHDERFMTHDERLARLEYGLGEVNNRAAGDDLMDGIALPEVEASELTTQAKLNRIVRAYAFATGRPHNKVWEGLFNQFLYSDGVSVKGRGKGPDGTYLSSLTEDELKKLYAQAFVLFAPRLGWVPAEKEAA